LIKQQPGKTPVEYPSCRCTVKKRHRARKDDFENGVVQSGGSTDERVNEEKRFYHTDQQSNHEYQKVDYL